MPALAAAQQNLSNSISFKAKKHTLTSLLQCNKLRIDAAQLAMQ